MHGRETGVEKEVETERSRHRDTETQRHRDTETQRQRHIDTDTHGACMRTKTDPWLFELRETKADTKRVIVRVCDGVVVVVVVVAEAYRVVLCSGRLEDVDWHCSDVWGREGAHQKAQTG